MPAPWSAPARVVFALLVLPLLAACASGGGGDAVFRAEVGMSTATQSMTIGERIFSQFQYTVSRTEEPPNLRMETEWRLRPPFDDERALGIVEAESRLVLMGRQRLETELGSQFAMTVMVENRVRVGTDGEWMDTRNTPQFRAYARSIAERLEQEFRTVGVRTF
jgi:hypothetical protein